MTIKKLNNKRKNARIKNDQNRQPKYRHLYCYATITEVV